MFEIEKNDDIMKLISITKSDSGISGPELARAHFELGSILGEQIRGRFEGDITVVAVMRGGIFFAEGLYFSLGCKFETYDPKNEVFQRPKTKNVIICDSVINTGGTLKRILNPDMYVACCVINENAVPIFYDRLYTIRVSRNSFVGTNIAKQNGKKGPDTTLRLFNQI